MLDRSVAAAAAVIFMQSLIFFVFLPFAVLGNAPLFVVLFLFQTIDGITFGGAFRLACFFVKFFQKQFACVAGSNGRGSHLSMASWLPK